MRLGGGCCSNCSAEMHPASIPMPDDCLLFVNRDFPQHGFSWRDGLVKESSLWPGLDGFTCSACVQVVSKVYADLDSQIRQERAGSRKIWWSRGSHVEASLL